MKCRAEGYARLGSRPINLIGMAGVIFVKYKDKACSAG